MYFIISIQNDNNKGAMYTIGNLNSADLKNIKQCVVVTACGSECTPPTLLRCKIIVPGLAYCQQIVLIWLSRMEGNVNDKKFAKVTDLTFITRSKVPYFEAKNL